MPIEPPHLHHVFARRVREEREKRGWSTGRLARESGLTDGTLTQLENSGRRNGPTLRIAEQLARGLSLPIEALLREDGGRPTTPPSADRKILADLVGAFARNPDGSHAVNSARLMEVVERAAILLREPRP